MDDEKLRSKITAIAIREKRKDAVAHGLELIKKASGIIRIPENEYCEVQAIVKSWIEEIQAQIDKLYESL